MTLKRKILASLILCFLFLAVAARADERDEREEREKRRDQRERREQVRVAMTRVKTCLDAGNSDCFEREDQDMRAILLRLYFKTSTASKKQDADFLKGN